MNASQPPTLARGAWLAVALLFPVALLNYLDRQMLAAMKDSVMGVTPQFLAGTRPMMSCLASSPVLSIAWLAQLVGAHVTDLNTTSIFDIQTEARWGLLGAWFKWIYAGLSPIGGFVADRLSKRWTVIASLGVWSVVTWWTGHVHTYEQMVWTRALMGISEAFYIPAALALIADFHSGTTRSRAVGTHQMGIYAGVAIGGFSGYIADSPHGWRAAFDWCGAFGLCYAVVLLFTLRDAPRPGGGGEREKIRALPALRELCGSGAFLLLVLYFTLPALAGWVVKDWMPPILRKMFDLGQGKSGLWATLPVTIASFTGALLGGMVADAWMRRTPRGRILASALGMVLCVPALFGIGYAPSLTAAVCFLVMFGIGWGFFDANNMPILCQITRPELRATGYGIMNLVSISAGAFATWRVGALRDAGQPPAVIFSICAVAAAVSVVVVLLIRPHAAQTGR